MSSVARRLLIVALVMNLLLATVTALHADEHDIILCVAVMATVSTGIILLEIICEDRWS